MNMLMQYSRRTHTDPHTVMYSQNSFVLVICKKDKTLLPITEELVNIRNWEIRSFVNIVSTLKLNF